MTFEGLSNSAGDRTGRASDSLQGATNETPTPIADDVRSKWTETRMRDGDFILTDKEGGELARVPFSDANFSHYMGGPLNNAARVEADQLARINAGRRSIGEPEVESLAALEQEQKQRRGPRRNLRDRDSVAYPPRTRERIQGNIRTTFRDLDVSNEVLQQLEQAVGQVSDHASARKLADFIATLPRKPGALPAGGRQMVQRPRIASHEGEPRHLTPGEIAAHAESLTGPAGGVRGGADYDKKMTPYTPDELAEAKKNLRKTFDRIKSDGLDERRTNEFNKKINDSATPDSVRALAAELRGIEDARVKALGRKIEQNRENAPGVYSNRAGPEFIEQNGNLYIREGKAIRLATEREKVERAAQQQAQAAAGGAGGGAALPPGPPPPRPPHPGGAPEPLPPPPRPPRPGASDAIPPPPPSWESRLDIKKFKRVRDTGPGGRWAGGFGTPRRFFYVHPDAPRNPDGSQRRFTEEEYQELVRQAGEGSPDDATVGRLHRGREARDPFEINKRDYINIRPKSLREIAANERDQRFFGEFMANLIPGESAGLLARAVDDGDLTERERKIVLYAQYEYTKRLKQWEGMSAKITGKHIEQAMKRYPGLEAAVRLNDSTGNNFAITAKVWKEELLHIAMRKDAADFNEVYKAQMKLAELHETRRFKNWDGDVSALCARAGVDSRDYDAVFNLDSWKDRRETRSWLKLNLQKDLKGFGRITGALGLTAFKANRMMKEADRLERKTHKFWLGFTSWTLHDVNKHEATLARVMAHTIGEPEKLKALTKAAMRNEEMQIERDAGPKNRQQQENQYAAAARGELSIPELQRMFNSAPKPAGWNTWNTAQREEWRDNSWNPSGLHHEGEEKRVGLWAQIFSVFKNWLFNDQKKKLSVA